MNQKAIELKQVSKYYQRENDRIEILKDISFSVNAGDSLAIVGPSGSGKTTLLGLCAGLEAPSKGAILLQGNDITSLNEEGRAKFRAHHLGFIFQNYQLLPTLTALENVMVSREIKGMPDVEKEAKRWLKKVGLEHRMTHYPTQLSGGEQQRVAIARAFANDPAILFADEPTGNLDDSMSDTIVDLLFELNATTGNTLVLVTHDLALARKTKALIRLKNGEIAEASYNVGTSL